MVVKVDTGIPIPSNTKTLKYPWRIMEIGDSFLVVDRNIKSMSPAASDAGKRHNKKFTCRTTAEGVRIWRTA